MSTSGIERLGFTKPISPKDKLSKKGSKNSSHNTNKVSDSLSISTTGKQVSEMFGILNSVKNKIEAAPNTASKVHNDFDLNSLGDMFGSNSSYIESVLKGVTEQIKNHPAAAVNVHNNINAAAVAKFIA